MHDSHVDTWQTTIQNTIQECITSIEQLYRRKYNPTQYAAVARVLRKIAHDGQRMRALLEMLMNSVRGGDLLPLPGDFWDLLSQIPPDPQKSLSAKAKKEPLFNKMPYDVQLRFLCSSAIEWHWILRKKWDPNKSSSEDRAQIQAEIDILQKKLDGISLEGLHDAIQQELGQ